jgi:glycosyltransferase involved in cell wall biosynthesis
MKILYVLPEFPPQYGGGIATYYDALIPAVAAKGHEVDVLVGSAFTKKHPTSTENGYRVEFLDEDRRETASDRFGAYEAVPPLRRTLAASYALFEQADGGQEYDIIETTDFGLLFLPWVVSQNAPSVLVQLHGSNGQISAHDPKEGEALRGHVTRLLELQGLAHADGLQSCGRPNAQAWSRRLGRDVWYSPPPLQQRDGPSPEESSADFDAEGFVAGRIQYWKGPTVLCEVQQHLGTDAPRIDWAGRDTDYRSAGASMTDHLSNAYPQVWEEKVRPIGEIPPQKVAERQAAAEFVVVPSIWDVFNYTAAEAMQTGSVVICSEGAGAADLIDHGENGFVVPAENAEALAEAVKMASELSDERRRTIARAAQTTIQNRLAPQVIAKKREHTYQKTQSEQPDMSVPSWLAEAVKPTGRFEVSSQSLAFLDQLPLRELVRYTLQRAWRKLTSSD